MLLLNCKITKDIIVTIETVKNGNLLPRSKINPEYKDPIIIPIALDEFWIPATSP